MHGLPLFTKNTHELARTTRDGQCVHFGFYQLTVPGAESTKAVVWGAGRRPDNGCLPLLDSCLRAENPCPGRQRGLMVFTTPLALIYYRPPGFALLERNILHERSRAFGVNPILLILYYCVKEKSVSKHSIPIYIFFCFIVFRVIPASFLYSQYHSFTHKCSCFNFFYFFFLLQFIFLRSSN